MATAAAERTAWSRNLAAPVRTFLATESGSAAVLLAAAVAALVWANSPWWETYESFWGTEVSLRVGDLGFALDLRHVVNQGLMTLFFLVVGLEAKRELDVGDLRERRRIVLPAAAAVGGMLFPIATYLAFNAGGDGADGWGVAMSTDTAFALGLLALVAPGGTRLRVALLSFAVVDDLAALLVIAIAYTEDVDIAALAVAAGLFAALFAGRYLPARWRPQLVGVLSAGIWLALFKSGVDPVIAGLAIGLVTSAYPPQRAELERVTELTRFFREQPTPELARSAQQVVASAISPNERLQYRLHPWTSYAIAPVFALANTGVHVDSDLVSAAMSSPVTLGILVAYLIGKPVGVLTGTWIGSRRALRGPRRSLSWPAIMGAGAVAGIPLTVSLLIASIAFDGRRLDEAKLGVVTAAALAAVFAWAAFRLIRMLPAGMRERQIRETREDLLDLVDDVDEARDHVRGPEDAPVTLLEYGDYECPYCGQAEAVIRELLASFGDDVRYVWRHLPLSDVHPHAQMAAEAAEAAADQGAFWDMHDVLLTHQDELTPRDLVRHAESLGLDAGRFKDALRERRHVSRVADDVSSADESGVAGTPTFFINGRRHQGAYDVATLTAEVGAARRRARLRAPAPA